MLFAVKFSAYLLAAEVHYINVSGVYGFLSFTVICLFVVVVVIGHNGIVFVVVFSRLTNCRCLCLLSIGFKYIFS